ncbi:mitochondrial import protein Pam17-domain-containing protein [Kalaharituber pfeilii]|nr:mitochondrial import protein Pam17-domain-containing protein [Kalaharituber pfeilii]
MLLSPAAVPSLRAAAQVCRSRGIPTMVPRAAGVAAWPALSQSPASIPLNRPVLKSLPASASFLLRRHVTTAQAIPNSGATGSSTDDLPSWDAFFALRRARRRYNRTCSVVTAVLGTASGAAVLGNIEVDSMPALFGFDMLTVFGLAILGCGALGWLLGPAVGGVLFRMLNRSSVIKGMAEREKQFFQHIKRNRVDPSNHSFANPVPDYYGEKVGSLKEYRQWLRDQRIYNRKRETFL